MRKKIITATILAVLLFPVAISAATLVTHAEIDTSKLNAEQVELIYLGKKTLWESGQRIVPVLLNEESAVSKAFLEDILKKSVSQYRAYWKRRLFSGGGTVPKTFHTTNEVIEYVAKTPGAIGVVDTGVKDGRVRIVEIE